MPSLPCRSPSEVRDSGSCNPFPKNRHLPLEYKRTTRIHYRGDAFRESPKPLYAYGLKTHLETFMAANMRDADDAGLAGVIDPCISSSSSSPSTTVGSTHLQNKAQVSSGQPLSCCSDYLKITNRGAMESFRSCSTAFLSTSLTSAALLTAWHVKLPRLQQAPTRILVTTVTSRVQLV